MRPTPRSNTGGSNARPKPTLEIIPNTRFIVFHGSEHEAAPVKLSGIVRLTTPESMTILKPKIRLEGKRKISWLLLANLSANELSDKNTFWTQDQKLGSIESAHKVKAGVIEWPFEFELSPSMPESVEGLMNTYIAYHLHASVSRPGWSAKDVVAQQHIRIVRTLGQESMEVTRSRMNSDIWANKVSYSISIPTDAFVFGTSISADVELSPLKKGLEMGKVDVRLVETVVKRIQASEMPDSRADRTKSEDTEVAKEVIEFPEDSKVTYDDDTLENPTVGDEMYRFKVTLPLPNSLNKCRQDVDSHQINITHRFKIMINLHNPEGHVSQLVCRLPVKIFISPNLPVDESNEVCRQANGATDEVLNGTETAISAPPQYGQHQLDELFSDMDPTRYVTRPPSLSGSPSNGSVRSRSSSNNDMENADRRTNGVPNGTPLDQHGSASPMVLQSRLADLQEENSNNLSTSRARRGSPSEGNSSSSDSEPVSRRVSGDQQASEVRQTDYDMNDLLRVPSYGHALRTSGSVTPLTDGPPTYVQATSRPSSPHMRPQQAHVRNGTDLPGGSINTRPLTNGVASLDIAEQDPTLRPPPRSHRGSALANEEPLSRELRTGS